jgi:cytoskeletal protein CcmA (bactofilin family)
MCWNLIRRAAVAAALLASFAVPSAAQDRAAHHVFAGNLFAGGRDVRVTEADVETLFAAGGTVTIDAPVRGTAHAAGRYVRVHREVGQNLYAAGYDVEIAAPVRGDLIAAGYRVEIDSNSSVGKDMLAAGRFIVLRGPVAGSVNVTARDVEIAGPISGSVEIRARQIRFGEGARIAGTLTYRSDRKIDVPASVIAPDRVTANVVARPSGAALIARIVVGLIVFLGVMLVLTAIFAFVFKNRLARAREMLATHPWRDLFLGIVATSALFGSILVLAVSLIGIPLIPLIVLLTPFAILAGYLTSAYAVGAALLGRPRYATGSGAAAFGAILVGLIVLAIVSAIPLLGWVVAVLAVIIGIGAWFALIVTPQASAQIPSAA